MIKEGYPGSGHDEGRKDIQVQDMIKKGRKDIWVHRMIKKSSRYDKGRKYLGQF